MNLVYPIKYVSSISDMICIQYIQYSENGMGKRESWLWRRTNVRISHNNGQKKTRWPSDDHGDDHDDDITMFCSVVCPCSSSSMPVVYICKTPFSLYTLATSTTLFVSLFVCCFVCCMSYVHWSCWHDLERVLWPCSMRWVNIDQYNGASWL